MVGLMAVSNKSHNTFLLAPENMAFDTQLGSFDPTARSATCYLSAYIVAEGAITSLIRIRNGRGFPTSSRCFEKPILIFATSGEIIHWVTIAHQPTAYCGYCVGM